MTSHLKKPRPPEFWVMRIILNPDGRPAQLETMTPAAWIGAQLLIQRGEWVTIPNGKNYCIAEPIEVYDTEMPAHEHRAKLLKDNPGVDIRVILNADVTV